MSSIQPQIRFINKLIRMRVSAERVRGNKKPGVMGMVSWLKLHIEANKYRSSEDAERFLVNHIEMVRYIIPSDKKKLFNELKNLQR